MHNFLKPAISQMVQFIAGKNRLSEPEYTVMYSNGEGIEKLSYLSNQDYVGLDALVSIQSVICDLNDQF